jgi:hypothetical protein
MHLIIYDIWNDVYTPYTVTSLPNGICGGINGMSLFSSNPFGSFCSAPVKEMTLSSYSLTCLVTASWSPRHNWNKIVPFCLQRFILTTWLGPGNLYWVTQYTRPFVCNWFLTLLCCTGPKKWTRIGILMSVSCPKISTRELLHGLWWNLICALCRWISLRIHSSWFPKVANYNMAETETCEVGTTVATIATPPKRGSHENQQWPR